MKFIDNLVLRHPVLSLMWLASIITLQGAFWTYLLLAPAIILCSVTLIATIITSKK